jgi:prefoldin subunit 5
MNQNTQPIDELCERRFALDARVTNIEKELAVIENKLEALKQHAIQIEKDAEEHDKFDHEQFVEIRSQLVSLDRDVLVQKSEISFIKATMIAIQDSIKKLTDHVETNVSTMKEQINELRTTLVRITAWGGGVFAVLMILKEVIMKVAFG